jgi:hypothetical protein
LTANNRSEPCTDLIAELRAYRDSLHAKGDPMGTRAVKRCIKIVQRHEKGSGGQAAADQLTDVGKAVGKMA